MESLSSYLYLLLATRGQKVLLLLLLLLSLLPAYAVNRWLRHKVDPRRNFARFLAYLALSLVFVFVYTYLVSLVIFQLFPPAKR